MHSTQYRMGVILLLLALSIPELACLRKKESQVETLRVGYLPIAECVQLYAGISQRFFEEQRLRVELQSMRGGAIVLPAVQQGDLDIGFSNVVSLVLLNSDRKPTDDKWLVSIAGATYERPGFSNHALIAEHPRTSRARTSTNITSGLD